MLDPAPPGEEVPPLLPPEAPPDEDFPLLPPEDPPDELDPPPLLEDPPELEPPDELDEDVDPTILRILALTEASMTIVIAGDAIAF